MADSPGEKTNKLVSCPSQGGWDELPFHWAMYGYRYHFIFVEAGISFYSDFAFLILFVTSIFLLYISNLFVSICNHISHAVIFWHILMLFIDHGPSVGSSER